MKANKFLTGGNLENFSYIFSTKDLHLKPNLIPHFYEECTQTLREYWQCKNCQPIYFSFTLSTSNTFILH